MCFLKHLSPIATVRPIHSLPLPSDKNDSETEMQTQNQLFPTFQKELQITPKPQSNFFLLKCLSLINFNSAMLFNLDSKLQQNQQLLSSSNVLLQSQTSKIGQNSVSHMTQIQQNIPQKVEQNLHPTCDRLSLKLFGQRHYRQRLILSGQFPDTLYKERNFGFSVKLIDISTGKQKLNGNLINICLGVCDSEGQWIHQTRDGTPFIKGKAEAQLYHGSGQFIKLSPKDVSRSFPNKMINLVVYPKPSMLRYSGQSSLEQNIDFQLIEPLIIRDVCVKAKRRQ